jgi:ribose transport system ATP-binding protein
MVRELKDLFPPRGASRPKVVLRPSDTGAVQVAGRAVKRQSPGASISAGMALVPEDRKGAGAVLSTSVLDNGSRHGCPLHHWWLAEEAEPGQVGG